MKSRDYQFALDWLAIRAQNFEFFKVSVAGMKEHKDRAFVGAFKREFGNHIVARLQVAWHAWTVNDFEKHGPATTLAPTDYLYGLRLSPKDVDPIKFFNQQTIK